jgi:hypothetical protein
MPKHTAHVGTLRCKLHGHTHSYVRCHCGHQYCAQTWAVCPRSAWSDHPRVAAKSRLNVAFRANVAAQQACPHWDYENPDGLDHDCCRAMREAHAELRKA